MGNLYTHIVHLDNPRLGILQKLKFAWRSLPRDYKLIHFLQDQLKKVDIKAKYPKYKKYVGIFDRPRGSQTGL